MDRRITKAFVHQHDESDCGVACLAMIARWYGGDAKLEHLRDLSGTERQGTTLLGLYQAANGIGFDAEGYKADVENLKKLDAPSIVHLIREGRLQHYVVCFGFERGEFIIGDPARGIVAYTVDQLKEEWQSGALLTMKPNESFVRADAEQVKKRSWIRHLVSEDLNVLGMALALGILIALLGLSVAIFSQKLIDEILPANDASKLTVGLVLLGLLLFAKAGLTYLRRFLLIGQTRDFNNRIIDYFYGSLLRLPKPFFDHRKIGSLVARMNDTERVQRAITYLAGGVMIDALTFVAAAAYLFVFSVPLGAFALLSLPLYIFIARAYHRPIVQGQKDVMGAYAANEGNYVDTIGGIAAIKGGNREEFFSTLTRRVYDHFQQKLYGLGKTGIGFNLWAELVGVTFLVAIIAAGSFMVLDGGLQLGQMMAIVQIVGLMIPSAGRLAVTNIELQEARVAFDRMFEFTLLESEYDPKAEAKKSAIGSFRDLTVEDLAFRFPGRRALLNDVSFSVSRGELIVLFGESGCGKTTTLQILQKFYAPEGGSITVNGRPWGDVPTPEWRDLVGMVPQSVKIFNGTLAANICMGDAEGEYEKVIEFCRAHGFDAYFSRLPQGYATLLGEEGVSISGGQQQLVALARALYRRPQLLLLDEATSAMDRDTERFVMELIDSLRDSMGVVVVTHRVQPAKKADRIYVIEEGYVRARGAHHDLIDGESLYARAWHDLIAEPVAGVGDGLEIADSR